MNVPKMITAMLRLFKGPVWSEFRRCHPLNFSEGKWSWWNGNHQGNCYSPYNPTPPPPPKKKDRKEVDRLSSLLQLC